jgi:FemAB-related protein (PEP-CTERM system-associated)
MENDLKRMNVRLATESDRDNWNQFVKESRFTTPFHLWEWGEIISDVYKQKRFYILVESESNIVAVLPLIYVKSRIFGNKLISLPFCEYGGFIFESRSQFNSLALKLLLDFTKRLGAELHVDYIELRSPPVDDSVIKNLISYEYLRNEQYVTFKLTFKKREELWKGLKKKTRNAIRKALKSAVKARIAEDDRDLLNYYELYLETQKRHGSPPHAYDFFKLIWDKFHKLGYVYVWLANYKNEVIAGNITFRFRDKMNWWSNVTKTKYRNLNPTNLLLWTAMEWGFDNNIEIFNFGRTRKGSSVHRFKRGWGGSEVVLSDYIYFRRQRFLPDPSQRKYIYLAKIWSHIPTSISRRLGPKFMKGIGL